MDMPYHPFNRSTYEPHRRILYLGSTLTREQLFLSELPMIERVIAWVCARRCLRGAEAEDFASTVKLRLIENDYAILGQFEGRSSLKTYLTAVVNRFYLDYQVQRFGKWRPSAQARRLGPVALRLESLLYRDGLTFEDAIAVLRTDPKVSESREALYEMSLKLPLRGQSAGPRTGGNGSTVPTVVEVAERQALARKTSRLLKSALERLPPLDSLMLRLHIEAGLSLADVARSLAVDQKALYRKRDTLLKQLRSDLQADGIVDRDVQELLSTLDWDFVIAQGGVGPGQPARQEGEP
jgi:RNA polymerase sigma factor for flagellar operon FliA